MAVIRRKVNYSAYRVTRSDPTRSDPSLKGFKDQDRDVEHTFQASKPEFDWINNTNTFQRIRGLLSLSDNWDGYGAKSFSRKQVQKALDLYSEVYQFYFDEGINFSELYPFVAPCSDGSILFEWSGNRFPYKGLEILVSSKAGSKPYEVLKTDSDAEEELGITLEGVSDLLAWLFRP